MKKIHLISLAIVLVVLGVGSLAWYKGYLGGNRSLYRLVQGNSEQTKLLDDAITKEKAIAENPDDINTYMDLGLVWKSLAERSPESSRETFFKRSLKVYELGSEKFGSQNILFYYNAGQVASEMGANDVAEKYYRLGIKASPADEMSYMALAQLYEFQMKKTAAEVLAVYNEAATKMVNPAQIVWGRASYLRRAGMYAEALVDYEKLAANYPNNAGYQEIVAELKAKIAETK